MTDRHAHGRCVWASGDPLMQTKRMAHLGGATLDIEENYVIRKLFTAGLGMVCVSNQARI